MPLSKKHPKLFNRHHKNPTDETTSAIAELFMPFAERLARNYHKRLPNVVYRDDMVAAANYGLLKAIQTYDLEKGVLFESHAGTRIFGEMVDELRKVDWVPRLVRERVKVVDEAIDDHYKHHGTQPSKDELRCKLGLKTKKEFDRVFSDYQSVSVNTFSTFDFYEKDSFASNIADKNIDPELWEIKESQKRYKDMMSCLRVDDKIIINELFKKGRGPTETAQNLGIKESLVYYRRNAAVSLMRYWIENKSERKLRGAVRKSIDFEFSEEFIESIQEAVASN